ncbi:hypothetical protein ACLMJK_008458 [Lecanora helva]
MSCKHHAKFCFPECTQWGRGCRHLLPRKYLSNDLVTGFKNVFTNKAPKQHKAIERWISLSRPLRHLKGDGSSADRRLKDKFDEKKLSDFFAVFDDFFFRGALTPWVVIKLVDFIESGDPDTIIFGDAYDYDRDGKKCRIRIAKPKETWTLEIVQKMMDTILHEMTHAVFVVFNCRGSACDSPISRATHQGVYGSEHGPNWRRLGQAIDNEANVSLRPLQGSWYMGAGGWDFSHRQEVEKAFASMIRLSLTEHEASRVEEAMFKRDL